MTAVLPVPVVVSLSGLDSSLGPLSVWSAMMIWARLLPIALLLPCLGSAPAPPSARLALGLAASTLVLALLATSMPTAPTFDERVLALDTFDRGLALAREFLAGIFIGVAASAIFWAGRAGFQLLGHVLIGLRSDAAFHSSMSSLGLTLSAAIFFAVDGHLALVRALAASYRVLPMAAAPAASTAQLSPLELIDIGGHVIDIAITIAAPALVAGGLAQLALALLQRVQPGIRIAPLMRPVGSLVALLATALALTTVAISLAGGFQAAPDTLQRLVR